MTAETLPASALTKPLTRRTRPLTVAVDQFAHDQGTAPAASIGAPRRRRHLEDQRCASTDRSASARSRSRRCSPSAPAAAAARPPRPARRRDRAADRGASRSRQHGGQPGGAAAAARHRHDQRLRLVDRRADLDRRRRGVQGREPGLQLSRSTGPGTGDGFKLFCKGETDISDASRKIKDEEADACKAAGIEYVELKIALRRHDRHDLAGQHRRHLPHLRRPVRADRPGVARASTSGRDAQALAKALGSNTAFPDADLSITGPGEESGTYDCFVERSSRRSPTRKQTSRPDRSPSPAPTTSSSANDNAIIEGVAGTPTARSAGSASPSPRRTRTRSRSSASPRTPTGPASPDRRRRSPTAPTRSRGPLHLRQQGQGRGEPGRRRPTSTTTWPTARSRRSSRRSVREPAGRRARRQRRPPGQRSK